MTNEDGSRPLHDSQHEAFAREWAKGMSLSDAYVAAGYPPDRKQASKLATKHDIKGRKEWFQRQAADGAVLTMKEKREFLALAVRTPLSEIDETSVLCQSAKYSVHGGMKGRLRRGNTDEGNEEEAPEITIVEIKMVDKHKAIEIDNDMAGDGSEASAKDGLTELMKSIISREA